MKLGLPMHVVRIGHGIRSGFALSSQSHRSFHFHAILVEGRAWILLLLSPGTKLIPTLICLADRGDLEPGRALELLHIILVALSGRRLLG